MRPCIAILLLAAGIGLAGCRGGGQVRSEEPTPVLSVQQDDASVEAARITEIERQRALRAEELERRAVQIRNAQRRLESVEGRLPWLDAELERLAEKVLPWAREAQEDLGSIPEPEGEEW